MSRNVISGNSKRTVTIDGVEYVVPDGYTLIDKAIGNKTAYATIPTITIDTTDTLYAEFTLTNNGNRMFGNQSAHTRCYVAASGNGASMFCGKVFAVALTEWVIDGTTVNTIVMDASGVTVNSNAHAWSGGTLAQDVITNFTLNEVKDGTSGTSTGVSGFRLFVLKDSNGNHKNAVMFLKKNSDNSIVCYDFAKSVFYTVTGTLTAGAELPTPEQPLGWKSVGDRTENLFNPDNANTRYPNGWYSSGDTIENSALHNRTIIIPCSEGDVFTFKHYTEASGARYFWIYSDAVAIGEPCSAMYETRISINAVTTNPAPSNAKYIGICFWRTTAGTVQSAADDFVIVKGSTAPTSYIPYGYKLTELLAQNCGMVDIGTLNWSARSDLQSGVFMCTSLTNKKVGLTNLYTSEYDVANETSSTRMADMEIIGNITSAMFYIRDTRYTDVASFKSAMSGKYLYYQRTTDDTWTPPTTITAYIDKPLGKVGTYADSFDMASGEHCEGIDIKVLDGTESFVKDGSRYYHTIPTMINEGGVRSANICCTHFKTSTTGTQGDIFKFRTQVYMYPDMTLYPDATAFKAYLAAQYAAGTPVTVWYPLATPTTSQHSPVQITLPKGTVIIDSDNEVKASNISATYKSQTNQ